MSRITPTALDQLVSELEHVGSSKYTGAVVPVQTRLQAHLWSLVEALTQRAGTSRNKVMNQLVEVGLQSTLDALPEDVALELNRVSGQLLYKLAIDDNRPETETM